MTDLLRGIHPVREALRAGQRPLQYLAIVRGRADARVQELIDLARSAGVPVRFESRDALTRLAHSEHHQGVVAAIAAKPTLAPEDLLAAPATGLLLLLDGIEDPHNLGAILRAACGAGVRGVIIPERRAAGLNETVSRVSAGALEHLAIARAGNLNRALEQVKAAGYWTAGLDSEAPQRYFELDFTLPTALVLGAEGKGLHEQVRRHCDFLVSIPMAKGVESLNVSVAAGVVLFEAVRQQKTIRRG